MPPKQTKHTPQGNDLPKPQDIYARALRCPSVGYAASPLFLTSVSTCPKCGSEIFSRVRVGSHLPLGVCCGTCPWLSTYPKRQDSPPAPPQLPLFDAYQNQKSAVQR